MNLENLEKRIAEIRSRLAAIPLDIHEAERALDREQERRDQVTADILDLTNRARAANGATVEIGADLAAAHREEALINAKLADLERETGPRVHALEKEREKLQAEMVKVTLELAKAKLSEAVMDYQAALCAALPHVAAIRRHAREAGVALPHPLEHSILIERGTHVCGGIVITL